jgi:autotransporter passenger strand-loop-strand repeat protein
MGITSHISDLMDNENNIALGGSNNTTSSHQSEVADSMVVDTTKINGTVSSGDDSHVASGNAAVGTMINEGGPIDTRSTEGTSVDTDGDGVSATLVQTGGR